MKQQQVLTATTAVLSVAMILSLQIAAVRAADQPEILTPATAPQPHINGAKVFGVRPGHPLLYTIAATGRRPMKFSITDLPEGLRIDETTGQITGSLARRETYRVIATVSAAMRASWSRFSSLTGLSQESLTDPSLTDNLAVPRSDTRLTGIATASSASHLQIV